jgi:hypothetical protein
MYVEGKRIPTNCPSRDCRSRKWNQVVPHEGAVSSEVRVSYPLMPAPQFGGPVVPVVGKRAELQSLIDNMQAKRKFPLPPCPTCRQTLKDEGDWFVCENVKCRVKRVSAEVIEAQWENRGQ